MAQTTQKQQFICQTGGEGVRHISRVNIYYHHTPHEIFRHNAPTAKHHPRVKSLAIANCQLRQLKLVVPRSYCLKLSQSSRYFSCFALDTGLCGYSEIRTAESMDSMGMMYQVGTAAT